MIQTDNTNDWNRKKKISSDCSKSLTFTAEIKQGTSHKPYFAPAGDMRILHIPAAA